MMMISESSLKKDKINWFIFLEMIVCTAIIWFNCSKNADMASNGFTLSFIILLIEFIKYIYSGLERIDKTDMLLFATVFISLFNVLCSLMISNKSVDFESLKNWITFISTVIFFRLAEKIRIGKKTADWIFVSNIIISLIYIYCKRAYPQEYSEFSFNGLTLNFSNANLTGMFVFLTLLYMCLGFFYYKNIIMRLICAGLALSNFSLLIDTESRNPLLAFVLFLAILVLSLFKMQLRFSKTFNFIVNIAPIAFVFLYLTLINTIMEKGWLDFLISEGKSLSSRVKIWKSFLSGLGNNWIVGDYANLDGNAHNSHMVLLCSFGVIILVLVIVLTYKITNNISERITNKFQMYCLAAFFAVIFMGFGEGALYLGGLGLYVFAGGFLLLANSNFDNNKLYLRKGVQYDKI